MIGNGYIQLKLMILGAERRFLNHIRKKKFAYQDEISCEGS